MTKEGEGDKSSTVDESGVEPNSIDALLAELLGNTAESGTDVADDAAADHSADDQPPGTDGGNGSSPPIGDLLDLLTGESRGNDSDALGTNVDEGGPTGSDPGPPVADESIDGETDDSIDDGVSNQGSTVVIGALSAAESVSTIDDADSERKPAPTGHPAPSMETVAADDQGAGDQALDSSTPDDTAPVSGAANDTTPDETAPDDTDDDTAFDSTSFDEAAPGRLAPSQPKPLSPVRTRSRTVGVLKMLTVVVLGLYALVVIAWGIDLARHQSTVVRGVESEGLSLAGMSRGDLRDLVDERQQELAEEPLDIRVGDTTITSDPVSLGMAIDGEQLVDDAMDIGRMGFFPLRPLTWLGSVVGPTSIETKFVIDADTTTDAAQAIVASKLQQPKEPEMILDGNDQLMVLAGETGTTISERELVGRLPATIEAGPPFKIELQPIAAEPTLDQAAVERIATDINELTAEPVRIQVLDDSATVESAVLKSWAVLDVGDELVWDIDQDRALADLKPLFPELGSEDQQARFTVVGGEPIIVPASETVICCDEDSVAMIKAGLSGPPPAPPDDEGAEDEPAEDDEEALLRTIVLEPTIVGFDEGVAELESLGIVEEVSTFTTEHACCQNRVKNIQRFADLMQGVVIRPGETFSLNGHVGRRTIEKGFVADGAINLGVLEPQVGGGISQYATTFFNASFFAGLEFVEYQSHSLYISRYPRGREATISWRKPDLKVRNNTPYGILVWNTYTPTSITVTFYSTDHLEVEALPLRRSSERQCRVDITPRLTTYPDGTEVEDTVYAVYRPGEGLDCNGNSTRPEEDQPAPASPVVQEPDPALDPAPDPTPDPPAAEPVEPNPDPPGED